MLHLNIKIAQRKERIDLFGMSVSFLCLIHCMAFPFLVGALPVMGSMVHAELLHWILFPITLLLGVGSLIPSYRLHRRVLPLLLGTFAMLLLCVSLLLLPPHSTPWLSIPGGGLMVGAHFLNRRYRRCSL